MSHYNRYNQRSTRSEADSSRNPASQSSRRNPSVKQHYSLPLRSSTSRQSSVTAERPSTYTSSLGNHRTGRMNQQHQSAGVKGAMGWDGDSHGSQSQGSWAKTGPQDMELDNDGDIHLHGGHPVTSDRNPGRGNYPGGFGYHGNDPYYASGGFQGRSQAQTQVQRHRSVQASEQMLYDVYEHTVGMIEELEKHEDHGKGSAGNSGLLSYVIPRGTKKPKHDVTAIIEAELTCLRAQMKCAPPEATQKAREKMLKKTLMWEAARAEKGIPIGPVDQYAKNVVQLLTEAGSMKLPSRDKGPKTSLNEQTVNDALQGYAAARHRGEIQDKEFHDNPNKEAAMRGMRQGGHAHIGARRLVELDPHDVQFRDAMNAVDLR